MENDIVVISGFSSSGKDTIANKLKNLGYNFTISTSTRPMRVKDGECEGNPYYFTDNEDFLSKVANNEFIEYRKYETIQDGNNAIWYYGVEKKYIDPNKPYVVVLDPEGSMDFKKVYKDRVKIFFIQVDEEERLRRAKTRKSFEKAEYIRRNNDDKLRFTEKYISNIADFIVQNYDLEQCVNEILFRLNYPNIIHVDEME